MDGSIYSNLGLKKNRAFQEKRNHKFFTLKDIYEKKLVIQTDDELKDVFINDLKSVLQKDNVFELIESFFQLEQNLNLALEHFDFEAPKFNFEEFYKNLSPVLMRGILESAAHASNAETILNSIKESIRIALEEELYQIDGMTGEL